MATPGAGAKETVHPFKGTTPADVNRRLQLWDPLFSRHVRVLGVRAVPGRERDAERRRHASGPSSCATASSTTPGNPLTADDAIFSLQAVGDVEGGAYGSPFANFMDLKTGFTKVDDLTFEMKLTSRSATRLDRPRHRLGRRATDLGRGPEEAGRHRAVHVRLLHRRSAEHLHAQPLVLDGRRPAVRRRARHHLDPRRHGAGQRLLQGEVDAVENFDFLQAKNLQDDDRVQLLNSPSEWTIPFITRFDKEPFKDVKVRQAMKLAIDRQALVDTVFFGFGVVGNDQFGKNGPEVYVNADLPQREYDPDAAKSLLAEAGYPDGIEATIELAPGCGCQGPEGAVVTAAQLYQQQAEKAGIKFKINQTSNIDQWNILDYPFSATWWSPGVPFVLNWFTVDSGYNEGWEHPEWDEKFQTALAELDETKRKELWNELQAQFYEESGHIIWGHYNVIDGLAPNVQGAYENSWPLSTYDFKSYWLAT